MSGKHKSRAKPLPHLPELEARNYSLAEFARALSVKVGTVKRWRHEGLPSGRLTTGEVVISPVHALPWIRERARPSTFAKRCVVYFAKSAEATLATGHEPIKIGSSVNPVDRLRKMDVEILATVPGDKRTELAFHALFADASVGNEWFRPVPELLNLIASLKAA